MSAAHPNIFKASNGYYCDSQSRIDVVKRCDDPEGLQEALNHDDLQKTVRTAIERRLKKLSANSANSAVKNSMTQKSKSHPKRNPSEAEYSYILEEILSGETFRVDQALAKAADWHLDELLAEDITPDTYQMVKITQRSRMQPKKKTKTNEGPTTIKLALIRAYETETQLREDLDHTHVDDLKDHLDELPPITVFETEEGAYYIGDGWHRYHAFANSARREIPAIIQPGGKAAALRYALGANAEHNALRRTNRDKRKAVLACLKSHSAIFDTDKVKNVAVAELCKVAESFVRKIRKEQDEKSHSANLPESKQEAKPAQCDFFDELNNTFKPIAEGWKTCINHTFFVRADVPKAHKLKALEEMERHLADHRQQLKDAKAKINAQEDAAEAEAPIAKAS